MRNTSKQYIKKKIKKAAFKVIKPFLPFLIIIVGIIFAICTVIDAVFITEADVEVLNSIENGSIEESKYYEWLEDKTSSTTIISNGEIIVSKDMFIWPIPGYTTITSPFGMRLHPIYGTYKLHSGTDVAAPIGADFVAMADGIVIKADYNSGYGNMVMIDHRKWNCYFICTWLRDISKSKSNSITRRACFKGRLNRKFNRSACTF